MFIIRTRTTRKTFIQRRSIGFSDVVFLIPKAIIKTVWHEYGAIAAAAVVVITSGLVYGYWVGTDETWGYLKANAWPFIKLVGLTLLLFVSLFRFFVSATKKHTPEK